MTWGWPAERSGARQGALAEAVERLCRQAAEEAVRDGVRILIISDETAERDALPIPALLAVGAVHHRLIRQGCA